jgi:hypothetical protein
MIQFIKITIALLIMLCIMFPASLVALFHDSWQDTHVLPYEMWTYKVDKMVETLAKWAKGEVSLRNYICIKLMGR